MIRLQDSRELIECDQCGGKADVLNVNVDNEDGIWLCSSSCKLKAGDPDTIDFEFGDADIYFDEWSRVIDRHDLGHPHRKRERRLKLTVDRWAFRKCQDEGMVDRMLRYEARCHGIDPDTIGWTSTYNAPIDIYEVTIEGRQL